MGLTRRRQNERNGQLRETIELDERRAKGEVRRESDATFNFDIDSYPKESDSCDIPS